MLLVTKLRNGVCFEVNNTPFKVIEFKNTHMSRGGGTIRVRVRNLLNGNVLTMTFKSGDKVESVDVSKKKLQYLYKEDGNYIFMDPLSFEQVEVEEKLVGSQGVYLKDGEEVSILVWDDKFLDLDLPPKMILKVVEADPGEKGDSASNVYKSAKLENGLRIRVPLFINNGDMVRVDTRTGEYVERA